MSTTATFHQGSSDLVSSTHTTLLTSFHNEIDDLFISSNDQSEYAYDKSVEVLIPNKKVNELNGDSKH